MRRLAVFSAALVMTLLIATPAAASKPVPGDGTYALDFGCVMDEGIPLRLWGTLAGCASVYVRENGSDTAFFDGVVVLDGVTYIGTATINFSVTDRFAILGGTGELAALHGQGTATDDPTGLAGTYEGWFHLDPAD